MVVDSDEEQLLEQLEEYEVTIAEARDSEDPVSQRLLGEALLQKGATLVKLHRERDSLDVWDEVWLQSTRGELPEMVGAAALLAKARVLLKLGDAAAAIELTDRVQTTCAAEEQSDRVRRLRLKAFATRFKALQQLDAPQTVSLDAELIRVFKDADDAELREAVMFALLRSSTELLREGQIDDALAISRTIIERIRDEPADALAANATMAVAHSRYLANVGEPSLISMAGFVGFGLVNTAQEMLRSLTESIPRPRINGDAGTAWGIKEVARMLSRSGLPEPVMQRRRRLNEAILVDRAVIDRLKHEDDPELEALVAKARTITAISQIVLGHPRVGYRALTEMAASGQLSVIQAFQSLAEDEGRGSSLANRLGEQGFLALRAQALGAGDKEIEQIAYEDSLKALPHRDDPRLVRWVSRLLRP